MESIRWAWPRSCTGELENESRMCGNAGFFDLLGSIKKSTERLAEDGGHDVIHREGRAIRQSQHVGELQGGPLPAIGFTPDDGHRRGSSHRSEEHTSEL